MGQVLSRCTPCCGEPELPQPLPTTSSARPTGAGYAYIPSKPTKKQDPKMTAPGTPSFRMPNSTPLQQEMAFQRKYTLQESIGMGSTSTCHKCRDNSTNGTFACKIIDRNRVSKSNSLLEQFENEIEVLFALQQVRQHPHIIHLEDVYITDCKIYMVMEFMQGGELFDYVIKKGFLSEAEASGHLRNIVDAVAYMHKQNIVHRDLKPENLLLTRGPNPTVKIIDFGLSKAFPDADGLTQSFLGTRGYLAPEMLKRQPYHKAVDIWALGVIAFILVCGCLPFDDDSAKITEELARTKFQLRFPGWAANLSKEAKDFLARLLEVDESKRITAEQALDHPWLNTMSEAKKKAALASPKHLRAVPRTPKRSQAPPIDIGGRGGNGRAQRTSEAPF